jgi:hypothetical protein
MLTQEPKDQLRSKYKLKEETKQIHRHEQKTKQGNLYQLDQWFSAFVRPRPGNFFFYKTRARYQPATRRLRNIDLDNNYS